MCNGSCRRKLKHEVTISGEQLSGTDTRLAAFRSIWRVVQNLIPEPETGLE